MTSAMRCLRLIPLICLGLASTAAFAQNDDIPDEWPRWLKKEMKKEYKRARYSKFSVGAVKGVMPGKIVNAEAIDDTSYYISSDDGSDAEYECWIWVDTVDMASTTSNISEAIIENVSSDFGPVNARFIRAVDAGAIDDSPFLALEWLYTVGPEGEARVAYTKVRTAQVGGAYITCGHSIPGYRKSFETSFARVVRDLEVDVETPTPYYKSLTVSSLNGINIGVSSVTFAFDEDGDTQIEADESTLAPVSESELRVSDTSSVSWSTPDGMLINKQYASVENNEFAADLALYPDEDGWHVAGTFTGKDVNLNLGLEPEPISDLGYMQQVQAMFGDAGEQSATLTDWVPSLDPTSFVSVQVGLAEGKAEPRGGVLSIGPLVIDSQFDANGALAKGEMNVGGTKLIMERVYEQGRVQ